MPLTAAALLDATHLLTFLLGAATGAAGTYLADKATDSRREKQATKGRMKRFNALHAEMPELIDEMAADLRTPAAALLRELAIIPGRGVTFNTLEPILLYYESEHPNLRAKARLLADAGFVVDSNASHVPRYRISAEFAELLQSLKPPRTT